MKSNQVVSYSFNDLTGVAEFRVSGVDGVIKICVDDLPRDVFRQAAIHGLKQKISDRAAIGRDPETGLSATPREKFDAMRETAERLANGGPWNSVGGGDGTTKRGSLFTALCELYPAKTPEELREWLGKKTKAEQSALRKTEKVAAKLAEIAARSGDAALGEDMLDELGGE